MPSELESIMQIDQLLSELQEPERLRILRWAFDKYGNGQLGHDLKSNVSRIDVGGNLSTNDQEITGIASLSDDGKLIITARDLKAKNTTDAGIRLVHIAIFAYEKLTGSNIISSRKVILPILRNWRAYTSNVRRELANHPGIIRDGDKLSLDTHAKNDAEHFINEILDNKIKGIWTPNKSKTKRKLVKKGTSTVRPKTGLDRDPKIISDLELRNTNPDLDLIEFYNKYKVNSNFEKNLIFIYFLTQQLKLNNVNVDHIYSCYRTIPKLKVPGVLGQSLRDTASNRAWIKVSNPEDIVLTPMGLNHLEHELSLKSDDTN